MTRSRAGFPRAARRGRRRSRCRRSSTEQRSADGTRKWMLRMDEVQGIETVYIPEPDRGTLCISAQVGCAMDCTFCSTAQQGFNRNLSVAEIVGQVWLAQRELRDTRPEGRAHHQHRVHGHGRAARQLPQRRAGDAHFHGRSGLRSVAPPRDFEHLGAGAADLQARRGVQRRARGLAARARRRVAQRTRADQPQAPDRGAAEACWHYIDKQNGRSVTFEYVMLEGVNDQPAHARALARLLARPSGEAQFDSLQSRSRERAIDAPRRPRCSGSATS